MPDRFYVPQLQLSDSLELEGPEAHHLARVLRAAPGMTIELFDGEGRSARAEVVAAGRKSVEVRVLEIRTDTEPDGGITLATAIPKGERFRWLIEKATELGVETLVPLVTARSVVEPGTGKMDKMRQVVVEACKQSGRNRLMNIEPLTEWADALRAAGEGVSLVAHPGGESLPEVLAHVPSESRSPMRLFVGPEGGLTDDEVHQARQAGARPVSLGPTILRIETAALALVACCRLGAPAPDHPPII